MKPPKQGYFLTHFQTKELHTFFKVDIHGKPVQGTAKEVCELHTNLSITLY